MLPERAGGLGKGDQVYGMDRHSIYPFVLTLEPLLSREARPGVFNNDCASKLAC